MSTPIQKLIDNYYELYDLLVKQGEISQSIQVNEHYRKILLLSCASYYEKQITQIIKDFVMLKTEDERIISFVNNKAINRQYHTYFQWDQTNNINQFLGLFGAEFKKTIAEEIKSSDELSKQISSFLEIGAERNKMVHQNFLEYQLEKTFDEIVKLHKEALNFINYIKSKFQ